jgi:hypothetical protein
MKVWILTSEVNDYDQHGKYFQGVFSEKPTIETLAIFFAKNDKQVGHNIPSALALIEHIRAGGGRRGNEDMWYYLEEVECEENPDRSGESNE